jgi:dihydrofolate reductase
MFDSDEHTEKNKMRKLITSLFITLDGVVESPDQWSFEHFDDGMMEELQSQLDAQDTVLLGRVTYEEWAGYWPTSTDEPFATYINNAPKFVVSNTLDKVEWRNSTLIKGDVAVQINNLKQQPGKNIGTAGSPTLVDWLLRNNLVDELVLTIYPVLARKGKRLFQETSDLQRLNLISSRATSTGVVIAKYQPRS